MARVKYRKKEQYTQLLNRADPSLSVVSSVIISGWKVDFLASSPFHLSCSPSRLRFRFSVSSRAGIYTRLPRSFCYCFCFCDVVIFSSLR